MNATGSKPCESPWALRCNSHCNIGPVREKDAFDCALAGNKQRRGSSAAAQLLGFGLQSAAGFYRSRNSWLSIAQQVSWVSFDDLPVCRPGPVFSATGSAERAMNVKIVRRGRYKIQPSAYPNEACHTSPKKCCALAIRTDLRALQIAEQDRRSGRSCRNCRIDKANLSVISENQIRQRRVSVSHDTIFLRRNASLQASIELRRRDPGVARVELSGIYFASSYELARPGQPNVQGFVKRAGVRGQRMHCGKCMSDRVHDRPPVIGAGKYCGLTVQGGHCHGK